MSAAQTWIAPDDELVSIGEVAERIGVSRVTAAAYCDRGLIPSRRVTRRRFVRRADLEAFLARRQAPASSTT